MARFTGKHIHELFQQDHEHRLSWGQISPEAQHAYMLIARSLNERVSSYQDLVRDWVKLETDPMFRQVYEERKAHVLKRAQTLLGEG